MMKRRNFVQNLTATSALVALPSFAKPRSRKRPNLLFIFSDQHASDMSGYAGNDQVCTPNLDAFSKDAVNLSSCFSMAPLCTPMRGVLLSGQHPLYNGAFSNCIRMLPGNGNYFAEVLKDEGYKTAYIGKWHLYGGYWYQPVPAGPYRYGFDDVFLTNNCDLNYFKENAFYFDQYTGEKKKLNEWEPDGQTRQAEEFLDSVENDEPWTMFVSWHAPHNHRTRKPEHYYAYGAPQKYLDLYNYKTLKLRPGTPDTEENRRMQHGYMAMVSSIDECFGRLTKKLEERGMAENTIVIYTSDHGDMLKLQDGEYFIKSRPELQSSQVPCLMRWPGHLSPGTENNMPFGSLDFMPTLLSMMEVSVPKTCQGRDLSEALVSGDNTAQKSTPLFHCSCGDWRGVATKDWVYSFNPKDPRASSARNTYNTLYDRTRDPFCERNLYGHPARKEVRGLMHDLALEWIDRFDDPMMPYAELQDIVLDPKERNGLPYIDFMDSSTRGVLSERPIDAARRLRKS